MYAGSLYNVTLSRWQEFNNLPEPFTGIPNLIYTPKSPKSCYLITTGQIAGLNEGYLRNFHFELSNVAAWIYAKNT